MFLYVFVKLENRNAWSFDKCVNKLNSITLPFSATFDNSCIGGISNYACAKVAYLHLVKMTFLKSPFLLNKRPLHEKYIITFVFVLSYQVIYLHVILKIDIPWGKYVKRNYNWDLAQVQKPRPPSPKLDLDRTYRLTLTDTVDSLKWIHVGSNFMVFVDSLINDLCSLI